MTTRPSSPCSSRPTSPGASGPGGAVSRRFGVYVHFPYCRKRCPYCDVAVRAAGVSRLSLGIQSLQDRHLVELGRLHDGRAARAAVALCREAGFDNLSVDLMIGLRGQREDELAADLSGIVAMRPEHVSL